MKLEEVTEQVRDIPVMSPEQGATIYQHIRDTKPELVLELGTANGTSAAYMAAALNENGEGHLITLDRTENRGRPADLLKKLGLETWVSILVRDDSSYDWFLKEQIAKQSDRQGNCVPIYDFCYLDGAHNWTIDGLAVFLVEKLLKPGGWLLVDDLEWSYAASPHTPSPFPMSKAERTEPHMRAVFELLIREHPNFTQFRVQDGNWGWAGKVPDVPRSYEITATRSLAGVVASLGTKTGRLIQSAIRPSR
jgi:predicted O-methyltransferase YrrM